jgi:CelD/BcsL family acetyltransferase involved in cellulose biosynthesis
MLVVHERQAAIDAGAGIDTAIAPGVSSFADAPAVMLSVYEDLESVEGLWRAFETSADCTVFQRHAWHATWQAHVGARRGTKPAIVVGRRNGHVLFVLPLAVETSGYVSRLVWHGGDLCDYNGPLLAAEFPEVVREGEFTALWRSVVAQLQRSRSLHFDTIVLARMPEKIGGQRNPFLDLNLGRHPSGAYMMAINGPWEKFYHEKRSSATRRHDRSKRKRLAESGEVSFVTAAEPCDFRKTFDAMFAQKSAQFAARGVPNFLDRPGVREFYRALAADRSFADVLHVARLQVGDTIAATNLGMVFRGRYYHVVASYDGGPIARFGPGTAHLHELIGYALERGCNEFDFTVGDEAYKRDWCAGEIRLYDYRAAATPLGWVVAHLSVAAARAKRAIKQTPSLWQAATRARQLSARFRGAPGVAEAKPETEEQA